ncbi:MAG: helix-turn-helix domain-containing protein [Enhygromyxa sp.]
MAASDHPSHPAIEILTADEVAALLRVNRKTVYEAANRGDIPHRRLGRRLVFERGAVLAWLRQETVIAGDTQR